MSVMRPNSAVTETVGGGQLPSAASQQGSRPTDVSAFETPREMEYFTVAEMIAQTGYHESGWALVVARELIDNALDAGATEIKIDCDGDLIITDNGPGIPARVIERSLDYSVRVSSKATRVAPTRGQMGNALKVVWAVPFVKRGETRCQVIACGIKHEIRVTLDRIAAAPVIEHQMTKAGETVGTVVRILGFGTPELASQLRNLVVDFSRFNEGIFTVNGERIEGIEDSPAWSTATSMHWYNLDELRDLIAATIRNEPDTYVRGFITQFRGLSSTRKCNEIGYANQKLADFVRKGDICPAFVSDLWRRCTEAAVAPRPHVLGEIGKDNMWVGDEGRYAIRRGNFNGRPYVIEAAFAHISSLPCADMSFAINRSPSIDGRVHSDSAQQILAHNQVEHTDPIRFVLHVSYPSPPFADRGKTKLALEGTAEHDLIEAVNEVTKGWKRHKEKKSEWKPKRATSQREVAFEVMERAFNHASSNGKYFANARQIMYAARPKIIERCGSLSDTYFTQTLLKDYIEEFEPEWAEKVVWDARGNLIEPHTGKVVPLGGRSVRDYRSKWGSQIEYEHQQSVQVGTCGPGRRYGAVLFIEKEGFMEIIQAAGIPNRFDIALMSTKGIAVRAACDLIEQLEKDGVQTFVLRDFDLAGFKGVRTLRNGTRLANGSNVIDLGLRLCDVKGLQDEPVNYVQDKDPRQYLAECGATIEECEFLIQERKAKGWSGRRVELNAMTSEQLILFIEDKLVEHGVKKVIPGPEALADAYRVKVLRNRINRMAAEEVERMNGERIEVPEGLGDEVAQMLEQRPELSWDQAIAMSAP